MVHKYAFVNTHTHVRVRVIRGESGFVCIGKNQNNMPLRNAITLKCAQNDTCSRSY